MADVTLVSRFLWITIILIHIVFAIFAYIKITQSSALSLPIPTPVLVLAGAVPVLPILAIILPAVISAVRRRSKDTDVATELVTEDEAPHRITPFARPVLSILAFVDVELIASALTSLNTTTLECGIASTWRALFSAKSVVAIRYIQDELHCCGFRTPRDQAFPFPDKHHEADACLKLTGQDQPCQPLLEQQEKTTLGTFVAVACFALAVKGVLTLFTTRSAGLRADGRPVWKSKAKNKAKRILPFDGEEAEGGEGPSGEGQRYRDHEEA
ncbi:MAG: hypothetical protein Q9162_003677 [Coniocarpon cinnabarinum]